MLPSACCRYQKLTTTAYQNADARRKTITNSSAIEDILNEFVATERSYVKRLRTLKHDYADPLRTFARSKDTAIISLYDANTLFGNIDNLLPVNEALLADLEKMLSPEGPRTVGFIGDVALRHFKDLHGFEQYKQYYVKREEAQSIFEREVSRRSSGFAAFVDVRMF
jgi:protein ECT2